MSGLCYDDDALYEMVSRLNTLFPESAPWRPIKARREHNDLFGNVIGDGDVYYGRQVGAGWDDAIRLSRVSMDTLLYALFTRNPGLREAADEVVRLRVKRMSDVYRRLGLVAGLSGDE
jgi:hypothetical protein